MPATFPLIAVFCEGDTERQYVLALAQKLKIEKYVRAFKTVVTTPYELVMNAYKETAWSRALGDKPIDEAWVMFDRDHHARYAETIALASKLEPKINICWSNPCIEYWFWLHYSQPDQKPAYDDVIEISSETSKKEVDADTFEKITVQRYRRTILPESMLKQLKKLVSYTKGKCPSTLLAKTEQAIANLETVGQSVDPLSVGSSMPLLIKRLMDLSREVNPKLPNVLKEDAVVQNTADAPKLPGRLQRSLTELNNFLTLEADGRPTKAYLTRCNSGISRLTSYDNLNKKLAECGKELHRQFPKLIRLRKSGDEEAMAVELVETQNLLRSFLAEFDLKGVAERLKKAREDSEDFDPIPFEIPAETDVENEEDRILADFDRHRVAFNRALEAVRQKNGDDADRLQEATEAMASVCEDLEEFFDCLQTPSKKVRQAKDFEYEDIPF